MFFHSNFHHKICSLKCKFDNIAYMKNVYDTGVNLSFRTYDILLYVSVF